MNLKMTRNMIWTLFIVLLTTFIDVGQPLDCAASKGMSAEEKGYKSPVVVTATVTITGRENHTAKVLAPVGTHGGGLAKDNVITFGPLGKGNGCPRIKKKAKFILYLDNADPDTSHYRVLYTPDKMKLLKKLQKVLCKNCVKPPKIKPAKKTKFTMTENQKGPSIKCAATGKPKPMAVFMKDGRVLTKSDKGISLKIKKKGGGGKLKIKKIKKEYEGVYTCQVTNLAGTANESYTIEVLKDVLCGPCVKEYTDYCFHGRCCMIKTEEPSCRCDEGWEGNRCEKKAVPEARNWNRTVIEARYHKQTIAIMAVCLALLAVIFICYVVYCRFKKSRSQLRKELAARNGHAGVTATDAHSARPAPNVAGRGIIGGDADISNIRMTGYASTNFSQATQPHSFTQRPQTYDDVIIPEAEGKPLLEQPPVEERRVNYGEAAAEDNEKAVASHLERVESNKRQRLGGIAIGQPGATSGGGGGGGGSGSDYTPRMSKRLDHLKPSGHSLASSTSSLASHDMKKPSLPIDEKLAHMARSGVYPPPSYHSEGGADDKENATDGPMLTEAQVTASESPSYESQAGGNNIAAAAEKQSTERMPSSVSSGSVAGSTHRVTTFDTDGKIQEETLGRDDGSLQGLTPHSPTISPQHSYQHSTYPDVHVPHELRTPPVSSPANMDNRYPHPDRNPGSNMYPYYEHSQDPIGSPGGSRKDHDDIFSSMEIPDTSLGLYSPKSDSGNQSRYTQPGSPDQSKMSPNVPYRHAPVTVASARHHYLPLLTKQQSVDIESPSADNKLLAGSTVSLSSTSIASSNDSERHRDSHKIEV